MARSLLHSSRYARPMYSLMVATAPLTEILWEEVGLADRATFSDTFDRNPAVHAMLRRIPVELFLNIREVEFTHAWGGNLGSPRDRFPSVNYRRSAGSRPGGADRLGTASPRRTSPAAR